MACFQESHLRSGPLLREGDIRDGCVVRLVILVLILGGAWDFVTTLYGVADFFDLPVNPKINPTQFMFGVAVAVVVFSFVLATHLIWSLRSDDTPTHLLKAAWATCIAIDLFTSW